MTRGLLRDRLVGPCASARGLGSMEHCMGGGGRGEGGGERAGSARKEEEEEGGRAANESAQGTPSGPLPPARTSSLNVSARRHERAVVSVLLVERGDLVVCVERCR